MLNWSTMDPKARAAIMQKLHPLEVEVQQMLGLALHFNLPCGSTGNVKPGAIEAALASAGYTIANPKTHPNGSVSGELMYKS